MPSQLSKRIAGRVTGACGHTVPVLVPCTDCVERQLDGWEQRIRDECKKDLTDDMKNAKADVVKWKAEIERVKRDNETLLKKVDDAQRRAGGLSEALAESKREVESLKVQLHANQAVAAGRVLKMVNEL